MTEKERLDQVFLALRRRETDSLVHALQLIEDYSRGKYGESGTQLYDAVNAVRFIKMDLGDIESLENDETDQFQLPLDLIRDSDHFQNIIAKLKNLIENDKHFYLTKAEEKAIEDRKEQLYVMFCECDDNENITDNYTPDLYNVYDWLYAKFIHESIEIQVVEPFDVKHELEELTGVNAGIYHDCIVVDYWDREKVLEWMLNTKEWELPDLEEVYPRLVKGDPE